MEGINGGTGSPKTALRGVLAGDGWGRKPPLARPLLHRWFERKKAVTDVQGPGGTPPTGPDDVQPGRLGQVGPETGARSPRGRATDAATRRRTLPTTSSTAGTSAVSCDVLHLVLGPLDLDLLGNLLCAVVGLLDGTGIGGLSGILTNLLNAILGILQA